MNILVDWLQVVQFFGITLAIEHFYVFWRLRRVEPSGSPSPWQPGAYAANLRTEVAMLKLIEEHRAELDDGFGAPSISSEKTVSLHTFGLPSLNLQKSAPYSAPAFPPRGGGGGGMKETHPHSFFLHFTIPPLAGVSPS